MLRRMNDDGGPVGAVNGDHGRSAASLAHSVNTGALSAVSTVGAALGTLKEQ